MVTRSRAMVSSSVSGVGGVLMCAQSRVISCCSLANWSLSIDGGGLVSGVGVGS